MAAPSDLLLESRPLVRRMAPGFNARELHHFWEPVICSRGSSATRWTGAAPDVPFHLLRCAPTAAAAPDVSEPSSNSISRDAVLLSSVISAMSLAGSMTA